MDEHLQKITNTVFALEDFNQHLGLHGMGGKIFLFENNINKNDFSISKFCEDLYMWKVKTDNYSFCAGKSGVNWVYSYLFKKGILDTRDYKFLCSDDRSITGFALSSFKKSYFDFLHGGLGVAWYIIYRPDANIVYSDFLKKVNQHLETILYDEIGLTSKKEHEIDYRINLSLSHGMASILKYYLQCYKQDIHPIESQRNALNIVQFYIANKFSDNTASYFPSFMSKNMEDYGSVTRLAWCYGDLSIGYIFLQVGEIFCITEIYNLGLEILLHSSNRRTPVKTGIVDGGICHGASGLAYIFNKLYDKTGRKEFNSASEFWISEISSYARSFKINDVDYLHYPQYNVNTNKEMINHSLLEGTCGVGVVLQSIRSKYYDWDYALMLND